LTDLTPQHEPIPLIFNHLIYLTFLNKNGDLNIEEPFESLQKIYGFQK
jgi:hypothetical protein